MEIINSLKELKNKIGDKNVGGTIIQTSAIRYNLLKTHHEKVKNFSSNVEISVLEIVDFSVLGKIFHVLVSGYKIPVPMILKKEEIEKSLKPLKNKIDYVLYRDIDSILKEFKGHKKILQDINNYTGLLANSLVTEANRYMVNTYSLMFHIYKNNYGFNIIENTNTGRCGARSAGYADYLKKLDIEYIELDPEYIKKSKFKMDVSTYNYKKLKTSTQNKLKKILSAVDEYYKTVSREEFLKTVPKKIEDESEFKVLKYIISNKNRIILEISLEMNKTHYKEDIDEFPNFRMILAE